MSVFRMSDKELRALLRQGQHSVLYDASVSTRAEPKRRSKYNATKATVDGITFDSKGEAARYSELKFQASLGIITHEDDWLQVPFELLPADGKRRAIVYRADFVYACNGALVAEDFKGFEPPAFKLKAKLFRAQYRDYVLFVNKDKRAVFEAEHKQKGRGDVQ